MKEIWNEVAGYEGFYEVSNLGQVKSIDRTIKKLDGISYKLKSRVLATFTNKRGYETCCLCKDNKVSTLKMSRLVAINHIPNPLMLSSVNHIDGDKHNNSTINLEWCSVAYNNQHAYDEGLRGSAEKHSNYKGDIIGTCRETGNTITLSGKKQITEAGFDNSNVYACVNGRIKSHKNYTFKRVAHKQL
jgi:hypothetical protein